MLRELKKKKKADSLTSCSDEINYKNENVNKPDARQASCSPVQRV